MADLATRQVPVASVRPGVLGDELVEFADGTRVWLDIRDGITAVGRLVAGSSCREVHLDYVEPCFDLCWYQLRFSTAGETGPTVLARMTQLESGTTWFRWFSRYRWRPGHH